MTLSGVRRTNEPRWASCLCAACCCDFSGTPRTESLRQPNSLLRICSLADAIRYGACVSAECADMRPARDQWLMQREIGADSRKSRTIKSARLDYGEMEANRQQKTPRVARIALQAHWQTRKVGIRQHCDRCLERRTEWFANWAARRGPETSDSRQSRGPWWEGSHRHSEHCPSTVVSLWVTQDVCLLSQPCTWYA